VNPDDRGADAAAGQLERGEVQSLFFTPWRRDVVVIVYASETGDRGFESRQGVRFLGAYTYIAMLFFVILFASLCMVCI
jgi:hypothetical protein